MRNLGLRDGSRILLTASLFTSLIVAVDGSATAQPCEAPAPHAQIAFDRRDGIAAVLAQSSPGGPAMSSPPPSAVAGPLASAQSAAPTRIPVPLGVNLAVPSGWAWRHTLANSASHFSVLLERSADKATVELSFSTDDGRRDPAAFCYPCKLDNIATVRRRRLPGGAEAHWIYRDFSHWNFPPFYAAVYQFGVTMTVRLLPDPGPAASEETLLALAGTLQPAERTTALRHPLRPFELELLPWDDQNVYWAIAKGATPQTSFIELHLTRRLARVAADIRTYIFPTEPAGMDAAEQSIVAFYEGRKERAGAFVPVAFAEGRGTYLEVPNSQFPLFGVIQRGGRHIFVHVYAKDGVPDPRLLRDKFINVMRAVRPSR